MKLPEPRRTVAQPLIHLIADQAAALRNAALAFASLREVRSMLGLLDRATRFDHAAAMKRPVLIALLGGTRAGKSTLFNELIGRAEASPMSDDEYGFTKRPVVAIDDRDRPLLSLPADFDAQFVPTQRANAVFCDTPDIDSLHTANHELTRRLIDRCDIVVYVTTPEKYAGFQLNEEVRNWASRKRWLFVLNKMDLVESKAGALRVEFDARLRALGFRPDDANRFLICARQPDRFSFPKLKEAIFTARPPEQVELLRIDGFLGYIDHAVRAELTDAIEKAADELQSETDALHRQMYEAYCKGLRTPDAAGALRVVLREATWRQLGQQCGWFMALPVWIRCRFAMLWASYQVNRMLLRGMNLVGLAGALASTSIAVVRGWLPLKRVTEALGPGYRRTVTEVARRARMILEDRNLAQVVVVNEKDDEANARIAAVPPAPSANWFEQTIRWLSLRNTDEETLTQLSADVERIGGKAARMVLGGVRGRLVYWSANLLPAAMFGWILCRIVRAWWSMNYLPLHFYGLAAALFAATLLVGYLALSWLVGRTTRDLDGAAMVEPITAPKATADLRQVTQRLRDLFHFASRLRQTARDIRQDLDREGSIHSAAPVNDPADPHETADLQ